MRRYYVGTNDYYYTANLGLEEAPWYVFAIENINFWICSLIPTIPLPPIKFIPKGETERTTWREWFGDTEQLYHVFICVPVFNWCQSKIKNKMISLPYFFLKEQFSEDFDNYPEDDVEGISFSQQAAVEERFFAAKALNNVFQDLMKHESDDIKQRIKDLFAE